MLLTDYDAEYDRKLEKLDKEMYSEIKSHKDVIPGSVCMALKNGVFAGAGLLLATPALSAQFLKDKKKSIKGPEAESEADKNKKTEYYVNGEYKAVPNTEYEIAVSVGLLDDMKESLKLLKNENKDKKISLRLFCDGEDLAYMEFLMYNGFKAVGIMPVFTKKIADEEMENEPENDLAGTGTEEFLSMKEHRELIPEYLKAYKSAFKSPQSPNEIDFRLSENSSDIICMIREGEILGAVSLRQVSKNTAILENLFIGKKFRKQGLASFLMAHIEKVLIEKGFKTMELTVEGDNHPAVRLYMKNRFELTGTSVIMKYEI